MPETHGEVEVLVVYIWYYKKNMNKDKLEKNSCPMSVSVRKNETDEDFELRWKKFDQLPQNIKDKLLDQKTIDIIKGIGKINDLNLEEIAFLSRMIRKYYFKELKKEEFYNYLKQNINRLNQKQINNIINIINQKIIEQNYVYNKKIIISLSLNEAFEKYPEITNQIITNKNIITKPFLKPLKPTVKNWIIVYEKILGVGTHTTIERGEFVFRAKATEGLSEEERNNLLILFKARDENSKLNIDLDEKKIIFKGEGDKKEEKNKQIKVNPQIIEQKDEKKEMEKEKQIQIEPQIQKTEKLNQQTQEKYTIGYIDHTTKTKNPQLHKFINSHDINVNDVNKKDDKNKSKQNVSNIDDKNILREVKEEINKNRTEMTNKQTNTTKSKDLIKKEKIGSQTYQIDNSIKKTSKIVGMPVKQNDISKEYNENIIKNNKKKKIQQNGTISFSSNHVMPAEREKQNKKQNIISPIGLNSN
jgi:hypothetical protein